jgi:hypothetical protein
VLCFAAVISGLGWAGPAAIARAAASRPSALAAQLTLTAGSRSIPPSFLGLSVEYNELLAYEREGSLFDRVISQIKPEDGTRMMIRIGGKSADHVYWQTANGDPPPWVTVIGSAWLTGLGALVRRDDLRVLLDLNLAVHSPSLEESFAVAAERALPSGSLVGLEIGNEPDLYQLQPWLEKQRLASTDSTANWAQRYSAADYRRDYISYARALVSRLPGIALGGPDSISANPQWLAAVEGLGRLDPGFLTVHRYASSTCWPSSSPWYPTVALMLSESSSAGLAGTVTAAAAFAHAHHQALRLTEVNSISCGGNPGVANSFATALWAPDVLFELIRAGVNSVSWHIRPSTVNAPFLAKPASIVAMPELYGLAMFSQMTRPDARLLDTKLSAPAALHLKAWAVRFHGAMRVLLIDKGPLAANVALDLGMSGHAFLKRLLAPDVASATGVTFGGQSIGPDARWHGVRDAPPVPGHAGQYDVSVPGYSAALLSVYR